MNAVVRNFLFLIFLVAWVPGSSADTRYQKGPFTASEAPTAPEWTVSKWIRGPEVKLADLRGQVVVIDFFQLWCPGCKRFSIPLMGQWEKVFAEQVKSKKMTLISIHTVFEGHSFQTDERLEKFVAEKNMQHPVAVDFREAGSRLPKSMIDFQTRGTPEIAIIDKNGKIRFQKLGGFDPEWATGFIRQLLAEPEVG